MADQQRQFEQRDDTFLINGNANPELLLRLYQVALVQNLNPTMEQNCLKSIIDYDKKNGTHYSKKLECFELIKQKGSQSTISLQEVTSRKMKASLIEKYGKCITTSPTATNTKSLIAIQDKGPSV